MREVELTQDQAGAAYALLREYAQSDYLAMMWMQQVEARFEAGESIESILSLVVRTAYRWYEKASAANYPTAETQRMCLQLFEAAGIDAPEPVPSTITHGDSRR